MAWFVVVVWFSVGVVWYVVAFWLWGLGLGCIWFGCFTGWCGV